MPRSSGYMWRILLPLVHGGIAFALVLNLPQFREARRRDIVYQQFIEGEARAKRWPPNETLDFEPDFSGIPQQISALYPSDLPALIVAGVLIIPSPASYHLVMEAAPGRMLPSTRAVIVVLIFVAVVVAQWYLIVRINGPPRNAASWQFSVYLISVASIPFGLLLPDGWINLAVRLSALPFWIFIGVRTLLNWRNHRKSHIEVRRAGEPVV
jgi:hypothetical protein